MCQMIEGHKGLVCTMDVGRVTNARLRDLESSLGSV